MTGSRKLVVGLDGTWNEPEQTADGRVVGTNVVRLLDAMATLGDKQVKHYEQGVGTRAWEALRGGIYGHGLDLRIQGAYRFLANRFADPDWERDANKVFLFGFSRGAYTARRIAGLLAYSGLPASLTDTGVGWEIYEQRDADRAAAYKREGRFFDVPVEMVGVWDTVKATDDPDYGDQLLSPNVKAGYHAIAIDERRVFFPVLTWSDDPRVKQVWFPGTHSDVGGGYEDAGLSDIALKWMIFRALGHGLQFDAERVQNTVHPDPAATLHESLVGIWEKFGELLRTVTPSAEVHKSVHKRIEQVAGYCPANLPDPGQLA